MKIITVSKAQVSPADQWIKFIDKKTKKNDPSLRYLLKTFKFHTDDNIVYVNINGIKKSDEWRTLGYDLVKYIKSLKTKKVRIPIHKHQAAFVEGLVLGDYTFNKYKQKPSKTKLKTIYIETTEENVVLSAIDAANAQCICRDLVNTTPEDMYSSKIKEYVEDVFAYTDVTTETYRAIDLEALGMNGHLAVNRASRHEALTIKLTYEPDNWVKHIVLVGKGLTYDSGGLSIKPANSMLTMKCDKAGAMTLIGVMQGILNIGSSCKITAYLGIAENMINEAAYKPDDIITMKNGKTVHVKNTDAEGRIVLFDNLCLAEEENPDADEIYTLATLTGAAVAMYGSEAGVMVGLNKQLKKKIRKTGKKAGEIFCEAEIHKYMMGSLKDELADLSNMGTPMAGCQKAGLFLCEALSKTMQKRYLHLDIAGPAFSKKKFGSNGTGGTGFGVRTFLKLLSKDSNTSSSVSK